jgi:plastocyanin
MEDDMLKSALLAVAALAMAMPAAAQTPIQVIQLYSFGYTPKAIRLAAGKPVTLSFSNRSRDTHDFSAKGFFARARIVSGDPSSGEIELRGGQSRSVTLIPAAGTYKVHCSHFMHKQFGMTGTIIVG